jgi:cytochrome c551/c552
LLHKKYHINHQFTTMKHTSLLTAAFLIGAFLCFTACNNEQKTDEKSQDTQESATEQAEVHGMEIKPGDVELTNPLNQQWVTNGKGIYDLKCQSCHRLTDERLVGPGWKDVTKRREPHWIMNMITNVDMMLEKDAEAQKLLEQCLVRMPNQNISKDDARQILEFMRSNDGAK